MKCTVEGCPGHYEYRLVVHTVKSKGEVIVFEDVPAEVCDVCSDTLLGPATVRHLEELLASREEPVKQAPIYAHA